MCGIASYAGDKNVIKTIMTGLKSLEYRGYDSSGIAYMKNGKITKTGLPISNVLYYELENNNWCCVRPSGTEPKIKFYIGVKGESAEDADEKLAEIEKEFSK